MSAAFIAGFCVAKNSKYYNSNKKYYDFFLNLHKIFYDIFVIMMKNTTFTALSNLGKEENIDKLYVANLSLNCEYKGINFVPCIVADRIL